MEDKIETKDASTSNIELVDIDLGKNEIIDKIINRYLETFSLTLDAGYFVPQKYISYLYRFIFKNLKKKMRQINKLDKLRLKDK